MKATVNGVTTTFIGTHFEWKTSTTDTVKYYYAGSQRIAMRVGNGTATSTLTYLLGDHLGSTSLTFKADTYATTTQLYKPWGEIRYQSGTLPTQYTYTGQYSHTADFGLMYYVARWYDPVLGRFAQADTLVPGAENGNAITINDVASQMYTPLTTGYYELPILEKLCSDNLFIQGHGGLLNLSSKAKRDGQINDVPLSIQGFDRYSYSLNNPINVIDPTGHDGRIIIYYAEWGPLSNNQADKMNNDKTLDVLIWATFLIAPAAGVPGTVVAGAELALILGMDDGIGFHAGDRGYTKVEYDPNTGRYISLSYWFDKDGNALFTQHLESWDGVNWWLVSQTVNSNARGTHNSKTNRDIYKEQEQYLPIIRKE